MDKARLKKLQIREIKDRQKLGENEVARFAAILDFS